MWRALLSAHHPALYLDATTCQPVPCQRVCWAPVPTVPLPGCACCCLPTAVPHHRHQPRRRDQPGGAAAPPVRQRAGHLAAALQCGVQRHRHQRGRQGGRHTTRAADLELRTQRGKVSSEAKRNMAGWRQEAGEGRGLTRFGRSPCFLLAGCVFLREPCR